MLSGVFEVLMALALVLSSLLLCGHIQYNEQTLTSSPASAVGRKSMSNQQYEKRADPALKYRLTRQKRQASGNQLARSQSMFSAVSSCQFWNETSLTFLLKPCRSAYFAAASTGSGVFSA